MICRCWQLLHDEVAPIEQDLSLLAADETIDDAQAEVFVRLLQHYRQVSNTVFMLGVQDIVAFI